MYEPGISPDERGGSGLITSVVTKANDTYKLLALVILGKTLNNSISAPSQLGITRLESPT